MTNGVVLWILKTNNLWLLLEGSCYSFFENKVHVTLTEFFSLSALFVGRPECRTAIIFLGMIFFYL